jgi:hypothetical protein
MNLETSSNSDIYKSQPTLSRTAVSGMMMKVHMRKALKMAAKP